MKKEGRYEVRKGEGKSRKRGREGDKGCKAMEEDVG